eukprot:2732083-Pyramimonas_sp.AAC.1
MDHGGVTPQSHSCSTLSIYTEAVSDFISPPLRPPGFLRGTHVHNDAHCPLSRPRPSTSAKTRCWAAGGARAESDQRWQPGVGPFE